jgi:hypothetical protein
LQEKAKCWCYDPPNGKVISIGKYATSGFRSFTPDSEGDRLLVIDDASLNLPVPGSFFSPKLFIF